MKLTISVYAGIYPADTSNFEKLNDSIRKLLLTDSSIRIQKESSLALGIGFRIGFLGMLHMEVFCDRLKQVKILKFIKIQGI
jgi:translation factor GUF1, mitochondrial